MSADIAIEPAPYALAAGAPGAAGRTVMHLEFNRTASGRWEARSQFTSPSGDPAGGRPVARVDSSGIHVLDANGRPLAAPQPGHREPARLFSDLARRLGSDRPPARRIASTPLKPALGAALVSPLDEWVVRRATARERLAALEAQLSSNSTLDGASHRIHSRSGTRTIDVLIDTAFGSVMLERVATSDGSVVETAHEYLVLSSGDLIRSRSRITATAPGKAASTRSIVLTLMNLTVR